MLRSNDNTLKFLNQAPRVSFQGLLDLICSTDRFCSYQELSGYNYLLQGYLCNVMAEIGQGYKEWGHRTWVEIFETMDR